jgi:hypothetical protein
VICTESQDVSSCVFPPAQRLWDKRFWNLEEMIIFVASSFVEAMHRLRDAEEMVKVIRAPRVLVPQDFIVLHVAPVVQFCNTQCKWIELEISLRRIDEHIRPKLETEITAGDLATELRVLRETIASELTDHDFAYIAQDKKKVYREWQTEWKRVLENFDEATKEIDQAVICFAMELYTATVFHMMRGAELGLRTLAVRVGVTLKHSIELEDWNTVLLAVDRKLEELHNAPKSPSRQAELKLYSDAASHLRYMKAWRNEMANVRAVYGEGEAKSALTRVRELLELMCP